MKSKGGNHVCNNIFDGTNWRECPSCGHKQSEKHWIDFREPSGTGDSCYYCEKCNYTWCPSCGEEIKIPFNAMTRKRSTKDNIIDKIIEEFTLESDHTFKEATGELSKVAKELKEILDPNPTTTREAFEKAFKKKALKDSVSQAISNAVVHSKLRGDKLKQYIKKTYLNNAYWKQRGITDKQFEDVWTEIENEI